MKEAVSLRKKIGRALEIPEEITEYSVKITLRGKKSLLVENHTGIVSYSEKKILFNSNDGLISVLGHGLMLVSLEKEELLIEGNILGLVFPGLLNEL